MKWHEKNEEAWPAFEKFLRTHLREAMAKDAVGGPFKDTAIRELTTGPLKPFVGVALGTMTALMWPTNPPVWVDRTSHAAFFSKTGKVIVVNRRIVQSFEISPARQDFRDALEMLMLHELLHWLIDHLGGKTEHFPRGDKRDAVYGFENAAYRDADARNATLERMNV